MSTAVAFVSTRVTEDMLLAISTICMKTIGTACFSQKLCTAVLLIEMKGTHNMEAHFEVEQGGRNR